MNNFFDQAFDYLIDVDEGSKYTDDPKDSGGPTKYGVTLKAYQNYIGRLVLSDEIRDMTPETAKKFYYDLYWKPLGCHQLDKISIALCIFTSGVLYGQGTAAIMAQKACSLLGATLKFDGIIGDRTIANLNVVRQEDFLKAFHGLVISRIDSVIAGSPKDEKYRKGWTNRADRLLTLSAIIPVINKTV